MAEDQLTEFAKLFKERDKKDPPSMSTGIVIAPPPEPHILLDGNTNLYKDRLVFAASVLGGYERHLKFKEPNWGITSTVNDGGQGASSHNHTVNLVGGDTPVEWTDTLTEGDEVILAPVMDSNLYYVLDKAVRFE